MFDLINRLLGVTPSAHHKERPPDGDAYWYGPVRKSTDSGIGVDEQSAMTFSTVFACTSKLAKTTATLPFHVHEPTGSSGSVIVSDHWLTRIWGTKFNDEVLAISGREAEVGSRVLWGNSYNEIVWADRFQMEADHLIPLLAKWMTVKRSDGGQLLYEYSEPGNKRVIPADRMLHIPGLSFNGIVGLSVIGLQSETVGMGMAATRHAATFFGNSAIPGVVLERPETSKHLGPKGAARLVADWDAKYQHGGTHKTALLEEGITAKILGMPLKDAQFLESRQFQRVEICGIFDVPPSKIHDDTRSTFSNVEQKNIDWKVDSIQPHCVRIERALRARFLVGTGLFVKHNMEGLVRGDTMARAEFSTKMIRVGVTVNEIRAKEDLPGVGPDGDVSFVSADLVPLPMVVSGQTMKTQQSEGFAMAELFAPMFLDAATRIVTKECKAVGNAWKKFAKADDAGGFDAWFGKFYLEQQEAARRIVEPVLLGAATMVRVDDPEQAAVSAARVFAGGYVTLSLAAIRDCIAHDSAGLPDELAEWQEHKAELLAQQLAQLFETKKEKTNEPT